MCTHVRTGVRLATTIKSQAYRKIVRPQLEYMHQQSGIHTRQKIHTTLTKYKTMQSRLVLFYKICHQNIAIPIPHIYKYPSELHATP